jgi:hypothetical protein
MVGPDLVLNFGVRQRAQALTERYLPQYIRHVMPIVNIFPNVVGICRPSERFSSKYRSMGFVNSYEMPKKSNVVIYKRR